MRYFTLLTVMLCFCLSCKETSFTEADKKRVTEEVRETLNAYRDAVNTSGFMAEFKYLDSSDDFFWIPPENVTPLSYDSVAAMLKRSAPAYRSLDNQFVSLRIYAHSNDLATYTAEMHCVLTDTAGEESESDIVETVIMIRREDGWKLFQGQTSGVE